MAKRISVTFAIVSILILIPLFTVSAGKPEHIILDVDDTWDAADCGDFIIQVHNVGKLYIVIDWEAMRATIRGETEDSFYRTDGVGPVYSSRGAFRQVYRLDQGKGHMDLGGVVIAVPGAGAILVNAGRVYYDNDDNLISYSGNLQSMDGDINRLCAAFR